MTSMSSNVSANKGELVTLVCRSRGYPPPLITWRRKLRLLTTNPRYHAVSSAGVGRLTIENVQKGDAGVYKCELVSRLYGSILSENVITVNVFDGKITVTCFLLVSSYTSRCVVYHAVYQARYTVTVTLDLFRFSVCLPVCLCVTDRF